MTTPLTEHEWLVFCAVETETEDMGLDLSLQ